MAVESTLVGGPRLPQTDSQRLELAVERYISSLLPLAQSPHQQDRENCKEAFSLLADYAKRHHLPFRIPSFEHIIGAKSDGDNQRTNASNSKPLTCFEMHHYLGDLWISREGAPDLRDQDTAEGLRRILLGAFERHNVATVGYSLRNGQQYPSTITQWNREKMDKPLAEIVRQQ